MKKFFNKLKAKLLYFLWDSRKPFFTVFFAVIIICFMISSVSFIVVYSNTGIFFKECDMNDYSRTFEPKKIEIDFKGNGEIIIRKSESVNIDFDDIFLTDNRLILKITTKIVLKKRNLNLKMNLLILLRYWKMTEEKLF